MLKRIVVYLTIGIIGGIIIGGAFWFIVLSGVSMLMHTPKPGEWHPPTYLFKE